MYTMVLMMSMSTAPDALEFGGRRFGCAGCDGASASCSGWACSGSACSGGSCSGWSNHHWSCSGASGAPSSNYSCHGGGLFHGKSCMGSYSGSSCNGSCFGATPNYYPSYGCHGYGIYGGVSQAHSAYPITARASSYGYGMPQRATAIVENIPQIEDSPKRMSETIALKPTIDKAVVAVKLPADALLYADGQLTDLSSSERVFMTPKLEVGQRYQYELKIEVARNGKTESETKKIFVKAGERTEVEFTDKAVAKVETAVSPVTVLLPTDAKLTVDRVANDLTGSKREFRTPALPKGAEFSYQFRAEIVRNGKPHAQTQVVTFKAGEAINVDFSDLDSVRTASK